MGRKPKFIVANISPTGGELRKLAVEWAREIAEERGCTFEAAYQRFATLPGNGQARMLWGSTWRRVPRL